jgi:hypothetical protein
LNLVDAVENTELLTFQNEQVELEVKLYKLGVYNASAAFDLLDQETKDLLILQYTAMNNYNEALKSRISLLTT